MSVFWNNFTFPPSPFTTFTTFSTFSTFTTFTTFHRHHLLQVGQSLRDKGVFGRGSLCWGLACFERWWWVRRGGREVSAYSYPHHPHPLFIFFISHHLNCDLTYAHGQYHHQHVSHLTRADSTATESKGWDVWMPSKIRKLQWWCYDNCNDSDQRSHMLW